jgi:hypothetical protein
MRAARSATLLLCFSVSMGVSIGRADPPVSYTIQNTGTLGTDSSGYGFSSLSQLNEAGVAIGQSEAFSSNGNHLGYRGVVWDGTTLTSIGTLGTDSSGVGSSSLYQINETGVAVGQSQVYSSTGTPLGARGVVWDGTSLTSVGTLGTDSSGFGSSWLSQINEAGVAVGHSDAYSSAGTFLGSRGVVWDGTTLIEMGVHGDLGYTGVLAISESNIAIGYSDDYDSDWNWLGRELWIWDPLYGQRWLSDLIPPDSGWELSSMWFTDIAEDGTAIGYGRRLDGTYQGFVLNPNVSSAVPEPSSLVLAGIGCLGGAMMTRRRNRAAKALSS